MDYLDFEQPIAELDLKIEELKKIQDQNKDVSEEIESLSKERDSLIESILENPSPILTVRIARHINRPKTIDYINNLFTEFDELHGDRRCSDDRSIISGLAKFNNISVVVVGHNRGRNTKENIESNFGMPSPDGYIKAMRLMKLAEKFCIPLITFVDTPGAYPGASAEEKCQSIVIAESIRALSILETRIVCIIIGEGGSGGALAIGFGDRILMLKNSVYSVISPEGCASILWRDQEKVEESACQLKLTATDLLNLEIIDEIIPEPFGCAHRNNIATFINTRSSIEKNISSLLEKDMESIIRERRKKILSIGKSI